jgi:hypothetical protein
LVKAGNATGAWPESACVLAERGSGRLGLLATPSGSTDHPRVPAKSDDKERLGPHLGRMIDEFDPEAGSAVDLDALFSVYERLTREPPLARVATVAREIRESVRRSGDARDAGCLRVPAETAQAWAAALDDVVARIDSPEPVRPLSAHAARDAERFYQAHGRTLESVEDQAFQLVPGLLDGSRAAFVTLVAWDQRYMHTAVGQRLLREAQVTPDIPFLREIGAKLARNGRHLDLGQQKQVSRGQAFMVRLLRKLTYGGRRSFQDDAYARRVYDRLSEIFAEVGVTDANLTKLIGYRFPAEREERWKYFFQTFLPRHGFRTRRPRRASRSTARR